ncbi:MAG: GDP-mannose 4,6-dehydratase [Candidatus Bathyarchaeia archaeon]
MQIEGTNVLITGGAGFIGSHLVDEYLKNGANKVVVYDDFSTGTTKNLEHINDSRLIVTNGSILDKNRLYNILRDAKINIIDHQAAELEVYRGITDSEADAYTNILGTLNVLNAALKNKVEKVLFASSGAVYGEAKSLPIDEDHPLEPHWPYGVSKLSAEKYVLQYHKLFGLNTTAFRYGIVYGPREWFGRVLTMFIKRIFLENKSPVVFGDGAQTRDYVYVGDVVRAHILAIKNFSADGQVFNISSGRGISIGNLAKLLVEMSGKNLEIIYDNPEEGTASSFQPERIRLSGELKNFILDHRKAQKVLGWAPITELKDGLIKEIDWILKNSERWKTKPRV